MATSESAPVSLTAVDRYARAAGSVLDAPVVCVSLLVANNRLMASSYGLPLPIALLHSWSLMRRAASSGRPFLITDGREDPLAAMSPSVRDGEVVSFMGIRLVASHGNPVGTLSVMDWKPRQWSFLQIGFLQYLSALLVLEFVSRNEAGCSDAVWRQG
jgi:GAF domain-containing protein